MFVSVTSLCRLALVLVSIVIVGVAGLSAASSLSVNIVGIPGGVTQSLPISYVQSFQRWTVEDGQVLSRVCDCKVSEIEWNDECEIRPTLDVLIKSGLPSYVMAGLQVRSNNQDLCPLARQWTTFAFAVEPSFRLETFVSSSNDDDYSVDSHKGLLVANDGNHVEQMKTAMELFGIVLSRTGEGSPLSEGFHIVSIPLESDWTKLPSPDNGPYTVTCLATAEPEAKELLDMDPGLVEMTASSVLELRVVPAGSESDDDATCSEEGKGERRG
jgi:hypothetical protein